MKNIIALIIIVFSITTGIKAQDTAIKNYGNADKTFKKQLNAALESYYSLKDALVKTLPVQAATTATALKSTMDKISAGKLAAEQKTYYTGHYNHILAQAKLISASTNVEEQREAFEQVSLSMYALIKSFKANTGTVYRQYCPMAFDGRGAYWLSDNDKVMNPYFGNKMLHCGSVEEEL